MSRELHVTSAELQSQWSYSEVPRTIWLRLGFVEKPRQRSTTAAVVVVVVEGAGGEVSRQSTELTRGSRVAEEVGMLLEKNLVLSLLENPESANS